MQLSMRGTQGLRGASQAKRAGKPLQRFSKAWNVGDKLTVFYPMQYVVSGDGQVPVLDSKGKAVMNDDGTPMTRPEGYFDIVTAYVPGHKVNDFKAFGIGTGFIPSLTDIVDGRPARYLLDENGDYKFYPDGTPMTEDIPGDVTYQFSRIAPLFIKGMKQAEIAKIQRKPFPSPELMREALETVEEKYDTAKNQDAPKPVVGRLDTFVATDVFVVPMTTDNKYLVDKAAYYTLELSNTKISQLLAILDDVKYQPVDYKKPYLEVQITFTGTSNDSAGRAEAGRKASPTGLTPEYTMEQIDPEAFAKVKDRVCSLPQDSKTISQRNYAFRKVDEGKIRRAIQKYMIMNSEKLDGFTVEEDIINLSKNAVQLLQYGAVSSLTNDNIKKEILQSYMNGVAENPEMIMQFPMDMIDNICTGDNAEYKDKILTLYHEYVATHGATVTDAPTSEPEFEFAPNARDLFANKTLTDESDGYVEVGQDDTYSIFD